MAPKGEEQMVKGRFRVGTTLTCAALAFLLLIVDSKTGKHTDKQYKAKQYVCVQKQLRAKF